jgi:uncharacterized protein YukE
MKLNTTILLLATASSFATASATLDTSLETRQAQAIDYQILDSIAKEASSLASQIQNRLNDFNSKLRVASQGWPGGPTLDGLNREWGKMFAGWDGQTRPALHSLRDGLRSVASQYGQTGQFPQSSIIFSG